jgi:hypothetical protein
MKSKASTLLRLSTVLVACGVFAAGGAAFAQDAVVFGDDNPNLAGRADGYACCNGDSVPDAEPDFVGPEFELGSCDRVDVSASGRVSFLGGPISGNNPDGDDLFDMTNYGDGISAPKSVRTNALVGVFLSDDSPTGDPTPPQLDFTGGLDFMRLEPEIGQIFFIGNGRTGDTKAGDYTGDSQAFIAPPGATRLYFGTADGEGWYNNSGSFTLSVFVTPYEPFVACGDAVLPKGVLAGDALAVLRCAVGASVLCAQCVVDVDHSGDTVASDALRVLRKAVGQDVELTCFCCPDLE